MTSIRPTADAGDQPRLSPPHVLNRLVAIGLFVVAAILLVGILAYAVKTTPTFDGAMNLQGAWSLSQGDGYRRSYGAQEPFPHSIQSNLPFTVPAAAVFGVFGIGTWQAQAANIAYLLALVGIGAFLVYRRFGALPAALAMIMLSVTPGLILNGLGGYGEVPALCLALAALPLFPWEGGIGHRWRIFLAGVCLALALATKTVLAICSGAFGVVFVLFILFDRTAAQRDSRLVRLALLAAGCVLPLLAAELWKFIAVGGMEAYRAWWQEGLGEISMQAGTQGGFQDIQHPLQKLSRHLELLGGYYGLPRLLLLLWLLLPFGLSIPLLRHPRDWRRHGPLIALLVATGLYFFWWLLITPTLKTYHRRIFDGSLLLNLTWAWVVGAYIAQWAGRRAFTRALGYALLLCCVGLAVNFFRTDLSRYAFKTTGNDDFRTALAALRGLPPDVDIFGVGWYSAPVLSLFAERGFKDFNDTPVITLDRSKPVYFVTDTPGLGIGALDGVLATYEARPLLPEGSANQIYEVRLDKVKNDVPPDTASTLAPTADLTTRAYPFTGGFHRPVADGTRWMTSDGFVILRYNGSPTLSARVYAIDFARYMQPDGIGLTMLLNDCTVGTARLQQPGVKEITLPIPDRCRPQPGQPATVRLLSDNLVKSGIILDDRSLSVVVNWLGFARPAP